MNFLTATKLYLALNPSDIRTSQIRKLSNDMIMGSVAKTATGHRIKVYGKNISAFDTSAQTENEIILAFCEAYNKPNK